MAQTFDPPWWSFLLPGGAAAYGAYQGGKIIFGTDPGDPVLTSWSNYKGGTLSPDQISEIKAAQGPSTVYANAVAANAAAVAAGSAPPYNLPQLKQTVDYQNSQLDIDLSTINSPDYSWLWWLAAGGVAVWAVSR